MHKASKGALAAAAAGALLLGGTGSLAFWTATAEVSGGSVNSGELTITDTTTGGCSDADWVIDAAEPSGGPFDPATEKLVPGDVLTKTCTFTIGADGTHLRADLAATGGTASGALASALTVAGTFEVDAMPVTSITEADDGKELTATVSVAFDPGAGNPTQLSDATLSDYTVSLTQAHG